MIKWDTKLPGFGVYQGSTKTTYVVQGRVNGQTVRKTICRCDLISPSEARKEAKKLLYEMSTGRHPVNKASKITLNEVFVDYLHARKNLKPRTVKDYNKILMGYLSDWRNKPIRQITPENILERHAKLGMRSEAQANTAMRVLKALFNFASVMYMDTQGKPIISDNPVSILSKTRSWYRVDRRRSVLKSHELPAFFEAVHRIDNIIIRDYLLFLLFTGMRPGEARRLKWEDVDLKSKIFVLPNSKNKDPYALPMSDYLCNLLIPICRHQQNGYVFHARSGSGHIDNPKRRIQEIINSTGNGFMLTDLRRTFATIAESLDLSHYTLKRLLNHKITGDVTAGYIVTDVERLRKPMQQIADYILKAAGVKEKAKVVKLARNSGN